MGSGRVLEAVCGLTANMAANGEQLVELSSAEGANCWLIVKFGYLTDDAKAALVAAGVADFLRTAKEKHPQDDNVKSSADWALGNLGV